MRRTGRGSYDVVIEPLTEAREKLDEGAITERYARHLERDIVAEPAGWWWSHKRWKKLRDRKRDAA
jgi:KDO2-lipid IV(A) lauroyltransferase